MVYIMPDSYAQAHGLQKHESPTLRTDILLNRMLAFNGSDILQYAEQPDRYTRRKESVSLAETTKVTSVVHTVHNSFLSCAS